MILVYVQGRGIHEKFTIFGGLALIPIFFVGVLFVLMFMVMMFSSSESGDYGGGAGWGSEIISELGESEIPMEYIPFYQAVSEKYGVLGIYWRQYTELKLGSLR